MSFLLILRLVFVFPEIPIFLSSILRVFFCYSGFLKIKYVEQLYISGFLACVNSFKQNNYTVEMSEAAVTVRVRKFMRNPLLKRRQMVLYDVREWQTRLSKSFILSVLLCLRRSLRLLWLKSTTFRTISASSSLDSKVLSVTTSSVSVNHYRRRQIYWLCSDLR